MTFSPLLLPNVIAHRGAPTLAPENTLAALRKAAELGALWVEFDVMLTADAMPIVMHDETLMRTTNGHGAVADMCYADIAQLDAGSWFSAEFAGEKVPKLSEFLEVARQLGLGLNLEIKATPGNAQKTVEVILDVLDKHWLSDNRPLAELAAVRGVGGGSERRTAVYGVLHEDSSTEPTNKSSTAVELCKRSNQDLLISSSCIESLRALCSIAEYPLALLLDEWTPGWQQMLTSLNCVSLNVHHSMLTLERVKEAKHLVKYVLAYTVNDIDTAQRCYDLGVDAVFSDRPDIFL